MPEPLLAYSRRPLPPCQGVAARQGRRAAHAAFLRGLAARVLARRRALGLTQQDLAALLGLTRVSVSFVEQAKHAVAVHLLPRLAGALGVTVDWLLTGAAPPPP